MARSEASADCLSSGVQIDLASEIEYIGETRAVCYTGLYVTELYLRLYKYGIDHVTWEYAHLKPP